MIDNSDGDFVLLSGDSSTGCAGIIVTLVLAGIIYAIAASNSQECSERKCDHGVPKLIAHDCLCVEPTKP